MFKPAEKEQLKVPGHHDYMPDLREFVSQVGRKYGLTSKLINTFKLAVDEAATNIIEHAYRDQQSHITIQAIVKKKSITIVLIDQGPFFDPNWAEEPDLLNSAETGDRPALGIFLLRKLIDKIDYLRTDAGNELRLTKYYKAAQRPIKFKPSIASLLILKSPYSLSVIAAFTIITTSFFLYSYKNVESTRISDFIFSGKEVSTRIANHLGLTRTDFLTKADAGIYLNTYMQPIYEEKVWQIHSISVTDSSGRIIWSTRSAEIQMPFKRPNGVIFIKEGIYNYSTDGVAIYEFEEPTVPGKNDLFNGKVHVLFLKGYLERQIKIEELHHLRNGLIVLGVGYIAIVLLVFSIKYPLGRFFKQPKKEQHQETDEVADRFDAFITRINDDSEWGKQNNELPKIDPPKQLETKQTDPPKDDGAVDKNEESGLDSPGLAKVAPQKPEYNSLQLTAPSPTTAQTPKASEVPKPESSPTADIEFTLAEFLDCLNLEVETARAATINFKPPAHEFHNASPSDPSPKIEEIQEPVPEPDEEIVETTDLNFEVEDISDSLVDAIFHDFADDKIGIVEDAIITEEPQIQEEKEEVSEKVVEPFEEAPDVQTEEDTLTEEDFESKGEEKPKTEIKLLAAPAQKEPRQTVKEEASEKLVKPIEDTSEVEIEEPATEVNLESKEGEKTEAEVILLPEPSKTESQQIEQEETPIIKIKPPTEVDNETEADTILVESIEDLLARIKEVHNLISQKDEPTEEPSRSESEPDAKVGDLPGKVEPESSIVFQPEEIKNKSESDTFEEETIEFEPGASELAENFLVTGVQYYRKKQYEDAIIAFRNLLKLEPDSKNLHLLLGNSYFKNNMMSDALSVYEQYKKKYPGESIAHENMALIYEKQGIYQLALKEWRAALDLNDDRPDIKRKIVQVEKAFKAETHNGNSVIETQQIERRAPHAPAKPNKQDEQKNTLLKEGIVHYRDKNFAAAINSFKVAIKLFPRFKEAYSFLGITYFRYKMFDESEQAFEKLKQLQFESESAHDNMGLIYAKQGSYRQAVDEWKKVLTVNPQRSDIKEKINKVVERL